MTTNGLLKRVSNWYFTKGALPYWCLWLADCLAVYLCGVIAFTLTHGASQCAVNGSVVASVLLIHLMAYAVGFRLFKTYCGIVRNSKAQDLARLGLATMTGLLLILLLRMLLPTDQRLHLLTSTDLFLQALSALALMGGLRVCVRILYDYYLKDVARTSAYGFSNDRLLHLEMEELLPREPIEVDMEQIQQMMKGKRILVTGAAGSIGSELVQLLANCCPELLILVDQAESPLHEVDLKMKQHWPEVPCVTWVTSICFSHRMEYLFQKYRPQMVFHAAAYKHVPMMEENPVESILNNVRGTQVLADLAVMYGTERFVMVSTDKAVNPTSVMGCSKRICEIYCQSLSESELNVQSKCQFITTRFGNVLGSNGSVIPIFREQIRQGGPVTVTHPDVIRYFMLIPEACKLVLEAATIGNGGEIFIFDMGKPVRIRDLAKRMIRLSGQHHIKIQYTGLRPGEKLYEEVLNDKETVLPTRHPKIKIARVRKYDFQTVQAEIDGLIRTAETLNEEKLIEGMKQLVPEYEPSLTKELELTPIRKIAKAFQRVAFVCLALCAMGFTLPVTAQEWVRNDTTITERPLETEEVITPLEPLRVVTNKFGKNWFLFGTVGAHTFRGDYSNLGSFSGTISPEWNFGVGKWFTPGVGLKVEMIFSDSRGYTAYEKGHYGYGDLITKADGSTYRKAKTKWRDISASAIINVTRLIYGYEGYQSPKRMNQFLFSVGVGANSHVSGWTAGSSDEELSAHVELQYSRFFTRDKRFSLDLKLRGLFYESNFDLEYGQDNYSAKKIDYNLGPQIGFTYYLGSLKKSAWRTGFTQIYQRDFRERTVLIERRQGVGQGPGQGPGEKLEYGTLTFFVFFPNNYSGRDDAPLVESAKVNAVDYLAAGLFTQKRFVDSGAVANRLSLGANLLSLPTEDIPTEKGNQDLSAKSVARGYELSTQPLSLTLSTEAMSRFRQEAGYYYAPINKGNHQWFYRVDEATQSQQLLDPANYKESASFGLNSHQGLELVRERMQLDKTDLLVSFADVYAAMNSNEGYVAQFTDAETVEHVRQILERGYITMIQTEGLSTSQDNYSGADSEQMAKERNAALSRNRAQTVIAWLKGKPRLNDVSSQIYMVSQLENGIHPVEDASTRGLDAKLNRCTKVRIHYMLQPKE